MTKLKRPERYVQFESIKPELKEITEFYTRKTADYQYKIKQLNEYVDALENEISVLKETPKVEVLLDNTAKPLVEVPKSFDKWYKEIIEKFGIYGKKFAIKNISQYGFGSLLEDVFGETVRDEELLTFANDYESFLSAIIYGYTIEKEKKYALKHIDLSKQYNSVSLYLAHGFYKELDHVFYKDVNVHNAEECHFTQSEIDELNIGSYEQIEVKVEDGE